MKSSSLYHKITDLIRSNWPLLSVMLVAALFRFWQIRSLPGGLFPDEAANGLDVNSILRGEIQPFYERGNGREALFFYLLAASVAFFGRGPWQHHIISAAVGFATILVSYFLTKRLFGKNVALLSSFLFAASSYATTLNRTAFRANSAPLLASLTLLFLVKFFQAKDPKEKRNSAIATGLFLALGFYTYISFRMIAALLFGLVLVVLFAKRGKIKAMLVSYLSYFYRFAIAFLAGFSWIGYYFLTHPDSLFARVGHVSIFSKDLNQGDVVGTFLEVSKATILGFFTKGDLNWRHNVSGFPFLSPLESPFFAVSLVFFSVAVIIMLVQAWNKKINPAILSMSLVAAWFWLMLVPEITTAEGIPHGLRLAGIIPAAFILPAWSMNWIWQKIEAKINVKRILAAIFLGVIFIYHFYLYFGVAANSPEYYYAFRSDLTVVSKYLNQRNNRKQTYLSLDKFSVQTADYLTTEKGQPYVLLDPAKTFKVELASGDQVIFTQSTLFDRLKFVQTHPDAKLVRVEKNKFGEIIMLVYEKN